MVSFRQLECEVRLYLEFQSTFLMRKAYIASECTILFLRKFFSITEPNRHSKHKEYLEYCQVSR